MGDTGKPSGAPNKDSDCELVSMTNPSKPTKKPAPLFSFRGTAKKPAVDKSTGNVRRQSTGGMEPATGGANLKRRASHGDAAAPDVHSSSAAVPVDKLTTDLTTDMTTDPTTNTPKNPSASGVEGPKLADARANPREETAQTNATASEDLTQLDAETSEQTAEAQSKGDKKWWDSPEYRFQVEWYGKFWSPHPTKVGKHVCVTCGNDYSATSQLAPQYCLQRHGA